VKKWTHDISVTIYESGRIDEAYLDQLQVDKTVCLKHDDFVKSASKRGGKDLYFILGLDINKVRKLASIDEQTRTINQAFKSAMAIHHPDKPGEIFTIHSFGIFYKKSL
jgi:hypothetical protein